MIRRRGAFTLIELLVVITIMMILAGTTTAAIFKVRSIMQTKAAKVDIRTITMALAAYQRELGSYPPDDVIPETGWSADPYGLNEVLVYYLGRKHMVGGNVYGPYIEFKTHRLVDRDGDGFDEYLDPFRNHYEYAENRSNTTPFAANKRNKGSYDIVSPGRDGVLGGSITAADGYLSPGVDAEKDNITNWSK